MSKELEDLIIEFDELGFEPTILCDSKKEIESFRNRLKQVLNYLKSIENSNPSEALNCIEKVNNYLSGVYDYKENKEEIRKEISTIKQVLIKAQEQEKALKEIIELIDDLEPTFNRNGVSSDTNILGTIIKNYFYDNASEATLSCLLTEKN